MANIRVTCPTCGKMLEIGAEHVGEEVECGECFQVFVAEGPPKAKIKAVPSPGKAPEVKGKPKRRRDDDDDYEHDQPVEEFDDDDYDPSPRRTRGGRAGRPPCQRLVYILLAIFLGSFGIHNFYAARTGIGAAQLAITLISVPLMCVFVGFITIWLPWIWALIEIVAVTHDGYGRWME